MITKKTILLLLMISLVSLVLMTACTKEIEKKNLSDKPEINENIEIDITQDVNAINEIESDLSNDDLIEAKNELDELNW